MKLILPCNGKLRYSVAVPPDAAGRELEVITSTFSHETCQLLVCVGSSISRIDTSTGCEVGRHKLPYGAIKIWRCKSSGGERLLAILGAEKAEKGRFANITILNERHMNILGVLPTKKEIKNVRTLRQVFDVVNDCALGPSILHHAGSIIHLYPISQCMGAQSQKKQAKHSLLHKKMHIACFSTTMNGGFVAVATNSLYESVKIVDTSVLPFSVFELEAILERIPTSTSISDHFVKFMRFHPSMPLIFGFDTSDRVYMWNYKTRRLLCKYQLPPSGSSSSNVQLHWIDLYLDCIHSLLLLVSTNGDILPLSFTSNTMHVSCMARLTEDDHISSSSQDSLIPAWSSCLGLSLHPRKNIFMPELKIEGQHVIQTRRVIMRAMSFDVRDNGASSVDMEHVYYFHRFANDPSIFRLKLNELENAEDNRMLILNFAEEGKTEFYPINLKTHFYEDLSKREKRVFGVLAYAHNRSSMSNIGDRSVSLFFREVTIATRETTPVLRLSDVLDFVIVERHPGIASILYIDVSGSVFYEIELTKDVFDSISTAGSTLGEESTEFLGKYKRIVTHFENRVTRVFSTPLTQGKRLLYYSGENSSLALSTSGTDLSPSKIGRILFLQAGEQVVSVTCGSYYPFFSGTGAAADEDAKVYFAVMTNNRILIADSHLRILADVLSSNSYVEFPFVSVAFLGGCALYTTDSHLHYFSMDGTSHALCSLPHTRSSIVGVVNSNTIALRTWKAGETFLYVLHPSLLEPAIAGLVSLTRIVNKRESRVLGVLPETTFFEKLRYHDSVRTSKRLFNSLLGEAVPRYYSMIGMELMKKGIHTVPGIADEYLDETTNLAFQSCLYDESLSVLASNLRFLETKAPFSSRKAGTIEMIRRLGTRLIEECQFHTALHCFTLIGDDWNVLKLAALHMPTQDPDNPNTPALPEKADWILPYLFAIALKSVATNDMKLFNAVKYMLPNHGNIFNCLLNSAGECIESDKFIDFLVENLKSDDVDGKVPFMQALWKLICNERDSDIQETAVTQLFSVLAGKNASVEFIKYVLEAEFATFQGRGINIDDVGVEKFRVCTQKSLMMFSETHVLDYFRKTLLQTLLTVNDEEIMKEKENSTMKEILAERETKKKKKPKKVKKKEKKQRAKKGGGMTIDDVDEEEEQVEKAEAGVPSDASIVSLSMAIVKTISRSSGMVDNRFRAICTILRDCIFKTYEKATKEKVLKIVTHILISPFLLNPKERLLRRDDFDIPVGSDEAKNLHETVLAASKTAVEALEKLAEGSIDLKDRKDMNVVDEIVADDTLYEDYKAYLEDLFVDIAALEYGAVDAGVQKMLQVNILRLIPFIRTKSLVLSKQIAAIIAEREAKDETAKKQLNMAVVRGTMGPAGKKDITLHHWVSQTLRVKGEGESASDSKLEKIIGWMKPVDAEMVMSGPSSPLLDQSATFDGVEELEGLEEEEKDGDSTFKEQPDLASEFKKMQRQYTIGGFGDGWDSGDSSGEDEFGGARRGVRKLKFQIKEKGTPEAVKHGDSKNGKIGKAAEEKEGTGIGKEVPEASSSAKTTSKPAGRALGKTTSFALTPPPSRSTPTLSTARKTQRSENPKVLNKLDFQPPPPAPKKGLPPQPPKSKDDDENSLAEDEETKEAEEEEWKEGNNDEMDSFNDFFSVQRDAPKEEIVDSEDVKSEPAVKSPIVSDGDSDFFDAFSDEEVEKEQEEGGSGDSSGESEDRSIEEEVEPAEPEESAETGEDLEAEQASGSVEQENEEQQEPSADIQAESADDSHDSVIATPISELEAAMAQLDEKNISEASQHLTNALNLTYEGRKEAKDTKDIALLRGTVQYVLLMRIVMKTKARGDVEELEDEDEINEYAAQLLISLNLNLRTIHTEQLMKNASRKLRRYGFLTLAIKVLEKLLDFAGETAIDGDESSAQERQELLEMINEFSEEENSRSLRHKCLYCGEDSEITEVALKCPNKECSRDICFSAKSLRLISSTKMVICPLCHANFDGEDFDIDIANEGDEIVVCPICRIGKLKKEEELDS